MQELRRLPCGKRWPRPPPDHTHGARYWLISLLSQLMRQGTDRRRLLNDSSPVVGGTLFHLNGGGHFHDTVDTREAVAGRALGSVPACLNHFPTVTPTTSAAA